VGSPALRLSWTQGVGEPESRFPHKGLFHQRALAGFTGTKRADPCITNTLTANSRRMAPRNAQILTAASTIATGNVTNVRIVAKSVAMDLAFEAKYVLHAVQCTGRILDAKKRPRNGMVFSRQLGQRYSFTVCAPSLTMIYRHPRRSGFPGVLHAQPCVIRWIARRIDGISRKSGEEQDHVLQHIDLTDSQSPRRLR
jgi:hypothetical protein